MVGVVGAEEKQEWMELFRDFDIDKDGMPPRWVGTPKIQSWK